MQLLPYTRGCFVCGADNPHGLHVKFHTNADGQHDARAVQTEFTPHAEHAGFKGIVHGGIVASLLDETMFWAAALAMKQFCVSAEMTVRYKRKAAVGHKLFITAKTLRHSSRLVETEGEIRDASKTLIAKATGKFLPLDDASAAPTLADFYPDPKALRLFDSQQS